MRNLTMFPLAILALYSSSHVVSQVPSDDVAVITRPYYVYENRNFELEFLVSGHTLSWMQRPSYLIEGTNIVVFYSRSAAFLVGTPAPPVVDILVTQEISGLSAGDYAVYVSPYTDEVPTEFDFGGTPRGMITIYTGRPDLDLGLGSPKIDEVVGGFGVIRGWACYSLDAKPIATAIGKVSYQIDDGALKPVPYGTSRGDVTERCLGNENTGFSAPINWNRYSLGEHSFKLFIDGEQVLSQKVVVSGTGETFLKGLDAEYVLDDFPNVGDKTTVRWSQSAQDFTIVGVERQ